MDTCGNVVSSERQAPLSSNRLPIVVENSVDFDNNFPRLLDENWHAALLDGWKTRSTRRIDSGGEKITDINLNSPEHRSSLDGSFIQDDDNMQLVLDFSPTMKQSNYRKTLATGQPKITKSWFNRNAARASDFDANVAQLDFESFPTGEIQILDGLRYKTENASNANIDRNSMDFSIDFNENSFLSSRGFLEFSALKVSNKSLDQEMLSKALQSPVVDTVNEQGNEIREFISTDSLDLNAFSIHEQNLQRACDAKKCEYMLTFDSKLLESAFAAEKETQYFDAQSRRRITKRLSLDALSLIGLDSEESSIQALQLARFSSLPELWEKEIEAESTTKTNPSIVPFGNSSPALSRRNVKLLRNKVVNVNVMSNISNANISHDNNADTVETKALEKIEIKTVVGRNDGDNNQTPDYKPKCVSVDDYKYSEFYLNGCYIDMNHNEIGYTPPSPKTIPSDLLGCSTNLEDVRSNNENSISHRRKPTRTFATLLEEKSYSDTSDRNFSSSDAPQMNKEMKISRNTVDQCVQTTMDDNGELITTSLKRPSTVSPVRNKFVKSTLLKSVPREEQFGDEKTFSRLPDLSFAAFPFVTPTLFSHFSPSQRMIPSNSYGNFVKPDVSSYQPLKLPVSDPNVWLQSALFQQHPVLPMSKSFTKPDRPIFGDCKTHIPLYPNLNYMDSGFGSGDGPVHIQDWESLAVLLPKEVVQACSFFKNNSNFFAGKDARSNYSAGQCGHCTGNKSCNINPIIQTSHCRCCCSDPSVNYLRQKQLHGWDPAKLCNRQNVSKNCTQRGCSDRSSDRCICHHCEVKCVKTDSKNCQFSNTFSSGEYSLSCTVVDDEEEGDYQIPHFSCSLHSERFCQSATPNMALADYSYFGNVPKFYSLQNVKRANADSCKRCSKCPIDKPTDVAACCCQNESFSKPCATCFRVRSPSVERHYQDFFCDCRTSDILEEQNTCCFGYFSNRNECVLKNPTQNRNAKRIQVYRQKQDLVNRVVFVCDKLLSHFCATSMSTKEMDHQFSNNISTIGSLCTALENIVSDGLSVGKDVWIVVQASATLGPATKSIFELVNNLSEIHGDQNCSVKFAYFINGLLRLRSLDCWLSYLVLKDKVLRENYNEYGFLRKSSADYKTLLNRLIMALQPLSALTFTKYADPFYLQSNTIQQFQSNHKSEINCNIKSINEKQYSLMFPTRLPSDSRIPNSSSVPSKLSLYWNPYSIPIKSVSVDSGLLHKLMDVKGRTMKSRIPLLKSSRSTGHCNRQQKSALSEESVFSMDASVFDERFDSSCENGANDESRYVCAIDTVVTEQKDFLSFGKGENLVLLEDLGNGYLRCSRGDAVGFVDRCKVTYVTFL